MAASRSSLPTSPFFKLVAAGEGIWAAVATDFTAAVGNSAVVDLGGRWERQGRLADLGDDRGWSRPDSLSRLT